jgi:hypothetical protein
VKVIAPGIPPLTRPQVPSLRGAAPPQEPTRPASVQFGGSGGISYKTAWQTLRNHFSNENNPQVAKAFVKKYGTDVIFPALFTIPVVGWALGILGMPVAGYLSKKGDKALEGFTKDPSLKQHPAVRAEEIANHWNKKTVSVNELASRWNTFIGSLFPLKEGANDYENNLKLHKRFQLSDTAKNSRGYKLLQRLVDAKNALEKSWVRHLAWPFTMIHNGLQKISFPSALRKVFLLPRYALLGLFFVLNKAPK